MSKKNRKTKKQKIKKRIKVIKLSKFQKICSRIKNICLFSTKMYDKYGMIILAWMPIIMFFFATFIAFIGILVIKRIETPIVWLGVSYVLIFALKLRFTTLLDSSKYTRSYKLITTVITLTAYFLVLPAMLTALAIAFRDLNAKVLLIIPLINYTAFKFFSSISILYNSYKGFQERPSGFQLFLFRCVY